MLKSKIDLCNPQWIEFVFYGRNKAYGAYDLRENNARTAACALIVGGTLFILAITLPLVLQYTSAVPAEEEKFKEIEIVLAQPPPVNKEEVMPPKLEEFSKPKVDQVKFPPPVVVPAEKVRDEEPPTIEELEVAEPGQKTIEGDPNAEIKIDEPAGEAESQIIEDNALHDFTTVEVLPDFPGGEAAWGRYLSKAIRYPVIARENNITGRVIVSFVVEKDGHLTEIKILRGIGGGCDEEAVRVLRGAPAWKPGIQNGRPVRVNYTMPIFFQLVSE